MPEYFSGQGKVYFAARNSSGVAEAFRYVGNTPQFDLNFATEVLEHKESWSGARAVDSRSLRDKTATLTLVMEEFTGDNLALALFGVNTQETGGAITDEPLAGGSTNIANGDYLSLAHQKASTIVINDSTPAPLTEGVDYRIESADHGMIQILDIGAYVQPFTADYASAEVTNVTMLAQGLTEYWVRMHGVNTEQGGKPVLVEVYRAAFDPAELFAWINNEFLQMTLNGSALVDEAKATDPVLGAVGRVVDIPAA